MNYLILEDTKFSLDGINVIEFKEGDVVSNLPAEQINALGENFEVVEDIVLEDTENDPDLD